jgi:predicted MFS family arabinose efflux permease
VFVSDARKWTAVIILTVVSILNFVDRFLPSILMEPIKHDLHLSDTQMGFINGFGFLLIYSVVALPVARLSDTGQYRAIICGSVVFWSLVTAVAGMAQNVVQLTAARLGVAVGESGSAPATHAFISRNFPVNRRSAPLAVLTLSAPLSSLIGLMLGGFLGQAVGWRATFVIMGCVGLVIAPLVFLILGRGEERSAQAPSIGLIEALKFMLGKRTVWLVLLGSGFISSGSYALVVFGPAFMMRVHGMPLVEIGLQYGPALALAGIVSLLLTGTLLDRLTAADARWMLWFISLMILVLLPFTFAAFIVDSRSLTLIFIALGFVGGAAYLPPMVATLHRLVPVEMRATASALLILWASVTGGAGPFLVGVISDALKPHLGDHSLGRALLIVPCLQIPALVCYFIAAVSLRADIIPD